MTEAQILQLYKDADAFLNVTGAQEIRDEHRAIKTRRSKAEDAEHNKSQVADRRKDCLPFLQ